MDKRKRFNQIIKGIKNVEIQGAANIAKKALYAYSLIPTKKSRKKLLSLRPTEPLLKEVLRRAENESYESIMNHFRKTQDKINKEVYKFIKKGDVIFTHCHSSTVINALIYAKNKGKKFEVYNTETRPLYQGRETARELRSARIPVTMFVDSGAYVALTKSQGTKEADKFLLGADALTDKGIINKIGSGIFAHLAYENKIPVYILADSWKYAQTKIKMEKRSFREVWGATAKKLGVKIKNPAFEVVKKKHIHRIISDLGSMKYNDFLKKVKS